MFTGLIREIAKVEKYDNFILSIGAKYKPNVGDSISVNGACLSVVAISENGFDVEISDESRSILAMDNYKSKVHIEPAMSMSDRIDGHIMSGHIDTIGEIINIVKKENMSEFHIRVDEKYMLYIAKKGSIAIDGVSLTINEIFESSFNLGIIPLTLKDTLLGNYKIGRKVNVETDFLTKQIAHIMEIKSKKNKSTSWEDIDMINSLY